MSRPPWANFARWDFQSNWIRKTQPRHHDRRPHGGNPECSGPYAIHRFPSYRNLR